MSSDNATDDPVKRHPLDIPPGPEGEARRRLFTRMRDNFEVDSNMVQEHNTCTNSHIDLKSVKFSVPPKDLKLE